MRIKEREERRNKKEERRQITYPKEAARGSQMRPPKVPSRGADHLLHYTAPSGGLISGLKAEGRAEKREKRAER